MKKYKTYKLSMEEAINFVRAAEAIIKNNYILDGVDKTCLFNEKTKDFYCSCLNESANLVDSLLEYELSKLAFHLKSEKARNSNEKYYERDAFIAKDFKSGLYIKVFPTLGKGGWSNPTVVLHADKDEEGISLEEHFLKNFLPSFMEGYFREWEARME